MIRSIVIGCFLGCAPNLARAEVEQVVGCDVAGYDLILTNIGTETLPIGSEISWEVPFARVEGVHVLTRILAPDERVFIVGANGSSYLTTDTPCTVSLS